ncbi:MAG: cupin domain-containing protein [Sphaerochaeta sp.]
MKDEALIERLGLQLLEGEGGFFRRVHSFLEGDIPIGSAIYYLITEESFSSLHHLSTDEIWFFLEGDALDQLLLNEDGTHEMRRLGPVTLGYNPLSVVKGGCYQGTKLHGEHGWALCATVMCPPFERSDFKQATDDILQAYPDCVDVQRFLAKEE